MRPLISLLLFFREPKYLDICTTRIVSYYRDIEDKTDILKQIVGATEKTDHEKKPLGTCVTI